MMCKGLRPRAAQKECHASSRAERSGPKATDSLSWVLARPATVHVSIPGFPSKALSDGTVRTARVVHGAWQLASSKGTPT
jgi:hypothetical protein